MTRGTSIDDDDITNPLDLLSPLGSGHILNPVGIWAIAAAANDDETDDQQDGGNRS